MKILSEKQCEEILKRITANEIIQAEYGLHDMEAETKATENRAYERFKHMPDYGKGVQNYDK